MKVEDEIVQYIDGNDRKTTNAGEMLYRGIELGVTGELTKSLAYRSSLSYSKQKYENFSYIARVNNVNTTLNYKNNIIGKAPRTLASGIHSDEPRNCYQAQRAMASHNGVEWRHRAAAVCAVGRDTYPDDMGTVVFVDPASSTIVNVVTPAARYEGWSFSILHKWNVLVPLLGRGGRDVLLTAVLALILGLGFLGIYIASRRKST